MAKKSNEDVALSNLSGFFQRGATTRSSGNIPTGHFKLDFILHHGISPDKVDLNSLDGYDPSKTLGLPLGKIVELFGEEGSGKSSLAYRVCGFAQKMGYDCVWIDAENSFSDNLADINGVDRESLIFSDLCNDDDPSSTYNAEDIMDGINTICQNNAQGANVGVVVVDSVASLVPKAKQESGADDQQPGVVARMLSENLKKVSNHAAKYQVLVIFINQVREKVGVMFGNSETTPGGRSLLHHASMRLRVGKRTAKDAEIYMENDDGEQMLLGNWANITIKKNRLAKPYRESIPVPIYYESYFPDVSEMLFDVARQLRIVRPYKGEFRWKSVGARVEGRRNFIDYVKYNNLTQQLFTEVKEASEEQGVLLPPEIVQKISENNHKLNVSKQDASDSEDIQETSSDGTKSKQTKSKQAKRGRSKKDSNEGS